MTPLQNASAQAGKSHQRKIHYIDDVLQKWMLIALVALETFLLTIADAVLYVRLDNIVEESLYRIHFAGQPSMFSVLLTEALLILGGLIAVNLTALFAADRIWSHYVRGILLSLRDLLSRTRDLDLRADGDVPQRHKVLAQALFWRLVERERHLALNKSLSIIENLAASNSTSDMAFRASLLALREHLPSANPAL